MALGSMRHLCGEEKEERLVRYLYLFYLDALTSANSCLHAESVHRD